MQLSWSVKRLERELLRRELKVYPLTEADTSITEELKSWLKVQEMPD